MPHRAIVRPIGSKAQAHRGAIEITRPFHGRRAAIAAQLVATLALIVAIAIAAVAVSMEIAEAGVLNSVHEAGSGIAFAALLALVVFGLGGLMAFVTTAPVRR